MNAEIIREVEVSNGLETRSLTILLVDENPMLWDSSADPNYDALCELEDETDTAVQDALSDGGEFKVS